MTGEGALFLLQAASALHPVGSHEPMPISQRWPSDAPGFCQRPLQPWAPFPLQWTLDDGNPFLLIPTEKPSNGCKVCTVKGYPKCKFLLLPEPVLLCSKFSHGRQEFVGEKIKIPQNTRVGKAVQPEERVCQDLPKQTDQPGAHIYGLLCCVPTAGCNRDSAYLLLQLHQALLSSS